MCTRWQWTHGGFSPTSFPKGCWILPPHCLLVCPFWIWFVVCFHILSRFPVRVVLCVLACVVSYAKNAGPSCTSPSNLVFAWQMFGFIFVFHFGKLVIYVSCVGLLLLDLKWLFPYLTASYLLYFLFNLLYFSVCNSLRRGSTFGTFGRARWPLTFHCEDESCFRVRNVVL